MFEHLLDDGWVAGLCLDEPAAELFGWPVTLAEVVAAPAGLELAAVLASVGDPAGVDDADLVDLLTGWEKLAAHVSACQAAVLAELAARRPPVVGEPMGNVPGVSRFAGDEAALALGVSRVSGESRLRDAVLLAGSLPGVLGAARDGVLSWSAARAVAEEAVVLPEGLRAGVAEFVLARCAGRTPGQVRRLARRAVLGVDPSGAAGRAARAVATRGVSTVGDPGRDE